MLQIGDSNSRIQSAASDAILHLARLKESGLQGMAATFVRPQKYATSSIERVLKSFVEHQLGSFWTPNKLSTDLLPHALPVEPFQLQLVCQRHPL